MARRLKKWILRYRGDASSDKGTILLAVLKDRSIQVLNNDLPKMVLVTGTKEEIESARQEMDANWVVVEENSSYPIPDARKKISS
jgi:hypothetical protein